MQSTCLEESMKLGQRVTTSMCYAVYLVGLSFDENNHIPKAAIAVYLLGY